LSAIELIACGIGSLLRQSGPRTCRAYWWSWHSTQLTTGNEFKLIAGSLLVAQPDESVHLVDCLFAVATREGTI